jgi:hypothetical protein
MAVFRISGIWKDDSVITHYAIHEVLPNNGGITRSKKYTKTQAVALLSTAGNSATTWLWNYKNAFWQVGETVSVVAGSYLRSNHDGQVSDNLGHLPNNDWFVH